MSGDPGADFLFWLAFITLLVTATAAALWVGERMFIREQVKAHTDRVEDHQRGRTS